jgi:aryl-alcohol dehydrogenase-like predicted oxidoreductase
MATLGLGTATFIPNYGLRENDGNPRTGAPIAKALDTGIRYVDTAPSYGDAEVAIGDLGQRIQHEQVRVCTKGDARKDSGALNEEFSTSLRRLRCDSVDTFLMHSARPEEMDSSAAEFFKTVKGQRRTKKIGASTYGNDAVFAIGLPWCDVVQVEHSILNPRVLASIVPLRRAGQEVVVRSVLCRGLLGSEAPRPLDTPDAITRPLDELRELAMQWGFALSNLSIRFALDSPGVDVALVGVATDEELAAAVYASQLPSLDRHQLKVLERFDLSHLDFIHPERRS